MKRCMVKKETFRETKNSSYIKVDKDIIRWAINRTARLIEEEERKNWVIHNRKPVIRNRKTYKTIEINFNNTYIIYIEPDTLPNYSMSFYIKNEPIGIGRKSSNFTSDFDNIIGKIRSLNTEYDFMNGDLIDQLKSDIDEYLNN